MEKAAAILIAVVMPKPAEGRMSEKMVIFNPGIEYPPEEKP